MTAASVQLAIRDFRGLLSEDTDVKTVGVNAARLFRNDPERVFLSMINLSANDIYLSPLPDVASDKGIFIGGNGGTITLNAKDDYSLVSREWYGIASAANSTLFFIEMKRATRMTQEEIDNAIN